MHKSKKFILIPLGAVAFLSLISFVVMQLWNHLLPVILHTGTIDFWQAMGLFILSKILFGFGGRGGRMGAPWMRGRMGERFKNMSSEERERFKNEMGNRCGWKRHDEWHGRFNRDRYATEKEPTEAPDKTV